MHWLELVTRHPLDFNFDDLSTCYKQAITQGDLRLLPAPFGVKTEVPRDTKLQMVTLQATAPRKQAAFEELEDEDLDAGFDFLSKHGPRSGSDLQQLRWQTKELREKDSPVFGWPQAPVDKALRTLSSDGALARKEFDWPLPLTSTFFRPWVLEILEAVWDFDKSSLVLLGESGAGKSPLGRSVLMAQCRRNKQIFECHHRPCIRCAPELDFLRGEPGLVTIGDFLDDPTSSELSIKPLKSLLDVGLYESMSWARWGAVKWAQNQPRALAANTYDENVNEGEDYGPA